MMYLYALVIICLFDVQTTRKFKRITKKMVQMYQFDIFLYTFAQNNKTE